MSLVEALKIKTHELDSKVDYIKSLEVDLAREKRAREDAERRALKLSGDHLVSDSRHNKGFVEEKALEPPLDSVELMEQDLPNGHFDQDGNGDHLSRSSSTTTIKNSEDPAQLAEDASSLASRLQAQLDLRNREMNDMKLLMESYRQKADEAEEGRRSLAQMVEDIRAGRDPKSILPATEAEASTPSTDNGDPQIAQSPSSSQPGDIGRNSPSPQHLPHQHNGSATIGIIHREIEETVSTVLQQQHPQQGWGRPGDSSRMVQSAPYVSMVGVVLIGVGIMTWLNGWQPGGEK